MRNKKEFLDDAYKVVRPEFSEALNVVEDAAHLMNQTGEKTYVIPARFTVSGVDEEFKFEVKPRPLTEDPSVEIPDYFYIGRDK